jgi:hypothetical protein
VLSIIYKKNPATILVFHRHSANSSCQEEGSSSNTTTMEKNEKLEKTRALRTNRIMALVIGTVALLVVYGIIVPPPPASIAVRKKSSNNNRLSSEHQQEQPQPNQQRGSAAIRQELPSESVLVHKVHELDVVVRKIKATGVFMEVDEHGLAATKRLQEATRLLLSKRYGQYENKPFRVRVDLTFQESNPTFATLGAHDSFVMELAPANLLPHSVFTFLEICRTWPEKKGAFHRRANHVLQVLTKGREIQHLAFQEYSPLFPHVKGTVGYAGRPCKFCLYTCNNSLCVW